MNNQSTSRYSFQWLFCLGVCVTASVVCKPLFCLAQSSSSVALTASASHDVNPIPDWVDQNLNEPFPVRQYFEELYSSSVKVDPYQSILEKYFSTEKEIVAQDYRSGVLDGPLLTKLLNDDYFRRSPDASDVQEYVSQVQLFFDDLAVVQQQTSRSFVDVKGSILSFEQWPIKKYGISRSIYRASSILVADACRKGDFEKAENAIRRGIMYTEDVFKKGVLIDSLVRNACVKSYLESIVTDYLSSPKLTAADCRRMLDLLRVHFDDSKLNPFDTYRCEYIYSRNVFETKEFDELRTWNSRRMQAEIAFLNDFFKKVLETESTGGTDYQNLRSGFEKIEEESQESDETFLGFVLETVHLKPVEPRIARMVVHPTLYLEAHARVASLMRMGQVIAAVRLYQIENETDPKSVKDAVLHAGMDQVPMDYYDGHEVKYVLADDALVIYCVGPDLVDDRGLADFRESEAVPKVGDIFYRLPRVR